MNHQLNHAVAEFKKRYPQFGAPVVADDAFGVEVRPENRHLALYPTHPDFSEEVVVDTFYHFDKTHLQAIRFWLLGEFKNLLITGPTGTGKSSLIEQVAARLGWKLFDVASSGSMDIEDLMTTRALKNGETVWEDGPAIQAMKEGGILLLDEGNAIDPSQLIGLHKLLDHRGFIDKDGNRLMPHPLFRIVMIGNAINGDHAGSYAGISRHMNIATKNRFGLCIEANYLDATQEILMLHKQFPVLDEVVIKVLVEFANGVRCAHRDGRLPEPVSTRKLVDMCRLLSLIGPQGTSDIVSVVNLTFKTMQPISCQQEIEKSLKSICLQYQLPN